MRWAAAHPATRGLQCGIWTTDRDHFDFDLALGDDRVSANTKNPEYKKPIS